MKIIYLMLIALACAPAADEKDAARLPEGPGKEVVGKICIDCHDSGNFRKARFTTEEWTDSVEDMVQRGATGTPQEIEAVVAYLDQELRQGRAGAHQHGSVLGDQSGARLHGGRSARFAGLPREERRAEEFRSIAQGSGHRCRQGGRPKGKDRFLAVVGQLVYPAAGC